MSKVTELQVTLGDIERKLIQDRQEEAYSGKAKKRKSCNECENEEDEE